jgi:putative sigma-54 modulation protein
MRQTTWSVIALIGVQNAAALTISVSGTTLTDALRSYASDKLSKPLDRYTDLLRTEEGGVELQMKVETRGKHDTEHMGKEAHIAEITARCKDKHIIHCASSSDSMYASLDDLHDTLNRKLRKYKEKLAAVKQDRRREDKEAINFAEIDDADDADDELPPAPLLSKAAVDAAAAVASSPSPSSAVELDPTLVRKKSFAMQPISVEDAITCLEYIDHDFYVFRNRDTDEVNVVYKRNHGGVGLIEPERD